jgi:hypothetical protein
MSDKIFVILIVISVLFSHSVEITIGDKKIGIHTSVLEEKTTARNMLCCYVDELKESFFPWIDLVNYANISIQKIVN